MTDSNDNGFGKYIPGFDFLQNLAKGASQSVPQIPNLGNWVAPTLNEEELDKRIAELKAVHFWLDQNSRALGATVQALEVQKMTLATLKGMNLNLSEMANVFKPKATEAAPPPVVQKPPEKPAVTAPLVTAAAPVAEVVKPAAAAAPAMVDPMQLWTSLTQQFQQIAASAMKEASKATTMDKSQNLAKGAAAKSGQPAKAKPAAPAKKRPAAKKAAKKSTPSAGAERGIRRR